MSAFSGIFHLDGKPADPETLNRQLQALHHWDADATGVWSDGPAGLTHLMLYNSPESLHDSQPAQGANPDLVFAGDLRIDNRDELIAQLDLESSAPDSALVLGAYEKWGTDCAAKLLGEFAFAIWDKRNQRFYCARDVFGQRPLYYFHNHRLFAFGSEPKAIFALPETPDPKPDWLFLGLYMLRICNEREHSIHRDIWRLPAAHWMVVDRNGLQKHRYWTLNQTRGIRLKEGEYVEAFREVLQRAVDARCRSAFPVGTLLSGGLDSSSISAFAHKSSNRRESLHTISWILPENAVETHDESPYIESFRQLHSDLDSSSVFFDDTPAFGGDEDIKHLNEGFNPQFRLSLFRPSYQQLREKGARTLLMGDFGDFTGSYAADDQFWGWFATGRWIQLIRQMAGEKRNYRSCFYHIVKRDFLRPILSNPGRIAFRRASQYQDSLIRQGRLRIHDSFLEEHGIWDRAHELLPFYPSSFWNPAHVNQIWPLIHGNWQYMAEYLFRYSLQHKIDSTMPFLDRRLVEFCTGIPLSEYRRDGWRRRLIREAGAHMLPEKIRWRRGKLNTVPNQTRRMRQSAPYIMKQFERWKSLPKIQNFLDVSGFIHDFQKWSEKSAAFDPNSVNEASFYPILSVCTLLERPEFVD
ncbi:MAG: asparagine synthase-related protein [Verrucomicrobiota bacterium]